MNSFWNKNIKSFALRFPVLAEQLKLQQIPEPDYSFLEVFPSKSGALTAKENSLALHSLYNPQREAETTVSGSATSEVWTAVFFSMGLGWTPLKWAEMHPDHTIIIIEPVLDYFFASLKYMDLTSLFTHPKVILALQAGTEEVTGLLESQGGYSHCAFIENKAQAGHAADYFASLRALIERNKKKTQINNWTLEKFSRLWLKNSCRNIKEFWKLDGVNIYKDKCPENLPVVLICAGPTLKDVLPHLKVLKNKAILIAVDTALHSCLNAGVEPDFIVLADPQYYAWRHIAGLKSPSSVLITESAAYPSVYRFECRKIVLCSSLFPLGQYFEQKLGTKGKLGAGGSVSTTAWDFARLIGAKSIYCAGLDLGYPKLESHIRGSLFEEKAHLKASRTSPSEKTLSGSLFAANSKSAVDYNGNQIFTDDKMTMFAWWFESKAQQFSNIKCYSLSSMSLAIPGYSFISPENLLKQNDAENLKKTFFASETLLDSENYKAVSKDQFDKVYNQLLLGFEQLYDTAKKGLTLAEKGFSTPENKCSDLILNLQKIDAQIIQSEFKEAASLVFPTEAKLNKLFKDTVFPTSETKAMFLRSKIIYQELMKGIRLYQKNL